MKKIIFIVGPTAVGKTDIAFQLARQINGEIVSCDSMQVYKELSIITSKPSLEMREQIPHHLIDVVSVEEEFNVAAFNVLATEAIQKVLAGQKVPVVVGGSGMYMEILLDGIFEETIKDVDFRQQLKGRVQKEGNQKLYCELQQVDSDAACKIHPNDVRRVIRALEVYHVTQQPMSQLQKKRCGLWGKHDIDIFMINRDRQELYARIDRRVEEMFQEGAVKEIEGLKGKELSLTAQRIIGVEEIQGYFNGDYELDQAKEMMQQNTRRFAKRQLTWFRRDKRLQWIDIQPGDVLPNILE
ncbi:MAG: tRNA (adenosine(37)-N6)-dimethylallyltransferase MiaA [Candidatus Omnitrophica bacterium]|nr:tRNA (adenosine(37)-N6)-dimethylallyltransferase MiaA [Candidatus Omnitrophota bacterium]